ncbi:hypothetical protein ETU10_05835 [Apibacter muscae]|uniref:hypothetical protein n=1 Tax=Apibacter muscae TaxID=2509004 RepID=UPI0011AC1C68|nr:hypothetical protein [Apibacter muscae]TWP23751.1 hypothetical protein ETU10_05835 [Apibacter muscae]
MTYKTFFNCILIILISLVSCKNFNDQSTTHNTISNSGSIPKFQVIIEGVYKKNDFIKVYYIDENDSIFSEKSSKRKIILGDDKIQKIIFEFPIGIKPKNLMLSMSSNNEQDKIFLKNITLKYGNDSISGDGGDFQNYFFVNECMKFNDLTYYYDLYNKQNQYNPVLTANDSLKLLMNKLYPPKILKK